VTLSRLLLLLLVTWATTARGDLPAVASRARVAQAETIEWLREGGEARRDAKELATLKGILAKPPFKASPFEEWQRRMQERWREWREGLSRRFLGNASPGTREAIARALYWGVLAILVALLGYLIWTYVPGLRLPGRRRAAGPAAADEIVAPERARARLAAAESAAAEGRYLEALRQTYAAMLLLLDEAKLLAYDPARSNGEVLRSLRAAEHARVREVLLPVTRAVDEKFYGGRPATAADYEGSRAACARLMGILAP
jgi:hypothetical protein